MFRTVEPGRLHAKTVAFRPSRRTAGGKTGRRQYRTSVARRKPDIPAKAAEGPPWTHRGHSSRLTLSIDGRQLALGNHVRQAAEPDDEMRRSSTVAQATAVGAAVLPQCPPGNRHRPVLGVCLQGELTQQLRNDLLLGCVETAGKVISHAIELGVHSGRVCVRRLQPSSRQPDRALGGERRPAAGRRETGCRSQPGRGFLGADSRTAARSGERLRQTRTFRQGRAVSRAAA